MPIVHDFVGKSRQNFEMSRYMLRKYKQKLKKRARLDSSSQREECRKVPLTPAERSKVYRERKQIRALDQPNTSAAAFALNRDDETTATTPIECSRSESYVKMVELPEVYKSGQYVHRSNIHYKHFCTDFTICIVLLVS